MNKKRHERRYNKDSDITLLPVKLPQKTHTALWVFVALIGLPALAVYLLNKYWG